jgi:hypothetical protein
VHVFCAGLEEFYLVERHGFTVIHGRDSALSISRKAESSRSSGWVGTMLKFMHPPHKLRAQPLAYHDAVGFVLDGVCGIP